MAVKFSFATVVFPTIGQSKISSRRILLVHCFREIPAGNVHFGFQTTHTTKSKLSSDVFYVLYYITLVWSFMWKFPFRFVLRYTWNVMLNGHVPRAGVSFFFFYNSKNHYRPRFKVYLISVSFARWSLLARLGIFVLQIQL